MATPNKSVDKRYLQSYHNFSSFVAFHDLCYGRGAQKLMDQLCVYIYIDFYM